MRLSRRSFLHAGVAGGALAGSGIRARTAAAPALLLYDSRLAASQAVAARHPGPLIDVANERLSGWRTLRRPLASAQIVGATRWSDYVIARGLLEEQRRRLLSDRRDGMLFHWSMG